MSQKPSAGVRPSHARVSRRLLRHRLVRAVLVLASLAGAGASGADALRLDDGKWDLQGRRIALATHDGRPVIEVHNGYAFRRDVALQDGTIELDVQLTRRRSFVYLTFRMADDREYEEIYLRAHKSGLPDAVQYAPVYQGNSAWQLYHGPGATAAVEFQPGAWTRVRLVLSGRQAALYVGDLTKPALLIPRLARAPRAGYIALRGFVPPGDDRPEPIARFADVTVRSGVVDGIPPAPAPAAPPAPGVVRAWAVSRPFLPVPGAGDSLPGPDVLGTFTRVEGEASGLVELHRHVELPQAMSGSAAGPRPRPAVVARVNVRAVRDGLRALDLGFSDEATVFLDGRPLFRADQSYSFDAPRREGLVGYDQVRLWLPLRAGDNPLAVLVSDSFGGWAVMGRFADPAGLEVEAR